MTAAELAKIIEIRDGLKAAFWDRDGWRWAAKFDQFIIDVQHAQVADHAARDWSGSEQSERVATPSPLPQRKMGNERTQALPVL
jgi:hypothetical protein